MIKNTILLINYLFYLFNFLILLRIFLSWIPSIQWYSQPWKFVGESTNWYLDIFRKFIPPLGMIDISPIIALLVLQIVQRFIVFWLYQILVVNAR